MRTDGSDPEEPHKPALEAVRTDGARSPIELVLFDLGEVLVHFRGAAVLRELTGAASEEEVWARWLRSPWMRRFDAGECSAQEFAAGAVAEWGLPYTPDEFIAAFRSWLTGPFAGAEALVHRTAQRCAVGCLSNMSTVHWDGAIAQWEIARDLEPRFVSCQLHLLKPDAAIFEYVRDAIDLDPAQVLFIDDNPVNVASAAAHGFQAARARGVEQAERALRRHGVID